jgi:hypothetical protein
MYWFAMLDVHASFGRQQSWPDVPHGEAQLAVMPVATGEIKGAVVVLDAEVTNGVIVALGTELWKGSVVEAEADVVSVIVERGGQRPPEPQARPLWQHPPPREAGQEWYPEEQPRGLWVAIELDVGRIGVE